MPYGKTNRDTMQQEKVGSGSDFWKAADGENRLRVMPPYSPEAARFWYRTGTHFGVGPDETPVACPEESGVRDSCFLCRLAKRLKKSQAPEDAEEGDTISVRVGYLINIVDVNHPEDGVQVWRCPPTQCFKVIKRLYLNEDEYGDMSSLNDGYDLIVIKEGQGQTTKYDVQPARQNSKFPSSKLLNHPSDSVAALYQAIANETFELPDLSQVRGEVELEGALEIVHRIG